MYLYAELWKVRPKWLELSREERADYVAGIGPAIEELLGEGVELLGFARNDEDTPHRADYRYIALWKMPDKRLAEALEASVEAAGFHDYFEQINARGAVLSPAEALDDMVQHPG